MMRAAALLALAVFASTPPDHPGPRSAHPRPPGTTELPAVPASPASPPVPPAAPIDRQRGVALGMFAEDVSFSYGSLLAEIVAVGATHVALVVPIYQTDATSHDLGLHTRFSPTLGALAEVARAAKRDGLQVTVFPIIRLSAPGPGQWRGTLAPRDRDAWFKRYGDLLGELAAVAGVTGATRLVVGSELSTLEDDLDRWRPVVERTRAVFSGKLVYSANWDHYRSAALFELVDEEGISGYFNLREAGAPADDATLEAGWRRARREIEAWRVGRTRPFVFTELGYRSRKGVTAAPWDEGPGGTPDIDEQRRAFAAFRRVWATAAGLDGVYIWNWYGYGGIGTTSYTPRGKPAELEVRSLLGAL
jgi:hypothetical protein